MFHKQIQEMNLGARSSVEGASGVEAPKTPEGWDMGRRCSHLHKGKDLERGQYPVPKKLFEIFGVKMTYFVVPWC